MTWGYWRFLLVDFLLTISSILSPSHWLKPLHFCFAEMLIFSIPQFFFLAWVMVVSLQMHGHRSCIRKERIGLLALKAYVNSSFSYDWPSDTNSNCCRWQRVECDPTSGRVIGLFLNYTWSSRPLLNLSLFYPFQELKTLDLNTIGCTSWFDDIHGIFSSF